MEDKNIEVIYFKDILMPVTSMNHLKKSIKDLPSQIWYQI